MLAQRAIWFRLLPMRATCRVRSRSTAAAGAVHVRVRAMACRSCADSDTRAVTVGRTAMNEIITLWYTSCYGRGHPLAITPVITLSAPGRGTPSAKPAHRRREPAARHRRRSSRGRRC